MAGSQLVVNLFLIFSKCPLWTSTGCLIITTNHYLLNSPVCLAENAAKQNVALCKGSEPITIINFCYFKKYFMWGKALFFFLYWNDSSAWSFKEGGERQKNNDRTYNHSFDNSVNVTISKWYDWWEGENVGQHNGTFVHPFTCQIALELMPAYIW